MIITTIDELIAYAKECNWRQKEGVPKRAKIYYFITPQGAFVSVEIKSGNITRWSNHPNDIDYIA